MFAARLKESCREYDYVARMGGDEFVVVAPGLVAEDAAEKVRKIEVMAEGLGQELFGAESTLAVSIGQSYYSRTITDADQLLTEADRRMYKTKQQHHTSGRQPGRVLQFQQPAGTVAANVC